MEIHKKRIKKEDGRYLIYYTFSEEKKESKDVRVKGFSDIIPSWSEVNRTTSQIPRALPCLKNLESEPIVSDDSFC
ncbi:unnamed protein product, partial [marine sediment metagenome]